MGGGEGVIRGECVCTDRRGGGGGRVIRGECLSVYVWGGGGGGREWREGNADSQK